MIRVTVFATIATLASLARAEADAGARCTAAIAMMGATSRTTAVEVPIAKRTTVTLLSSDGTWVELRMPDGTVLFVTPRAATKACGEKATAALAPPLDPASTAEQSLSLRVANQVDMSATQPSSAPSAPSAPASPPTQPAAPPPATRRSSDKTATGKDKIKVAVMDLKASEQVPKELRVALTALVTQTLDELGPFKAISKQDIEQMLALEAMKDAVGCNEVSCLAEIGGALGADYLIAGSVVLVGDTYLTQLQLLNIKTQRPEQRVSREYRGGPQGLLDEMRFAAKLSVRDLLAARSGTLALSVREEGATVRVDGSIIGTTPLKPITLAGGPHTVIIEREQFVRHSEDVSIDENKETQIDVALRPSEEFKKSDKARALSTRVAAYVLTIGGGLLLGTGGALFGVNQGEFANLRSDTVTFNAQTERLQSQYNALEARQRNVNMIDGLAVGAVVLGAAAAGVGIALFVTGDNPSKYDEATLETDTVPKPNAQLTIGPARGAFDLSF